MLLKHVVIAGDGLFRHILLYVVQYPFAVIPFPGLKSCADIHSGTFFNHFICLSA